MSRNLRNNTPEQFVAEPAIVITRIGRPNQIVRMIPLHSRAMYDEGNRGRIHKRGSHPGFRGNGQQRYQPGPTYFIHHPGEQQGNLVSNGGQPQHQGFTNNLGGEWGPPYQQQPTNGVQPVAPSNQFEYGSQPVNPNQYLPPPINSGPPQHQGYTNNQGGQPGPPYQQQPTHGGQPIAPPIQPVYGSQPMNPNQYLPPPINPAQQHQPGNLQNNEGNFQGPPPPFQTHAGFGQCQLPYQQQYQFPYPQQPDYDNFQGFPVPQSLPQMYSPHGFYHNGQFVPHASRDLYFQNYGEYQQQNWNQDQNWNQNQQMATQNFPNGQNPQLMSRVDSLDDPSNTSTSTSQPSASHGNEQTPPSKVETGCVDVQVVDSGENVEATTPPTLSSDVREKAEITEVAPSTSTAVKDVKGVAPSSVNRDDVPVSAVEKTDTVAKEPVDDKEAVEEMNESTTSSETQNSAPVHLVQELQAKQVEQDTPVKMKEMIERPSPSPVLIDAVAGVVVTQGLQGDSKSLNSPESNDSFNVAVGKDEITVTKTGSEVSVNNEVVELVPKSNEIMPAPDAEQISNDLAAKELSTQTKSAMNVSTPIVDVPPQPEPLKEKFSYAQMASKNCPQSQLVSKKPEEPSKAKENGQKLTMPSQETQSAQLKTSTVQNKIVTSSGQGHQMEDRRKHSDNSKACLESRIVFKKQEQPSEAKKISNDLKQSEDKRQQFSTVQNKKSDSLLRTALRDETQAMKISPAQTVMNTKHHQTKKSEGAKQKHKTCFTIVPPTFVESNKEQKKQSKEKKREAASVARKTDVSTVRTVVEEGTDKLKDSDKTEIVEAVVETVESTSKQDDSEENMPNQAIGISVSNGEVSVDNKAQKDEEKNKEKKKRKEEKKKENNKKKKEDEKEMKTPEKNAKIGTNKLNNSDNTDVVEAVAETVGSSSKHDDSEENMPNQADGISVSKEEVSVSDEARKKKEKKENKKEKNKKTKSKQKGKNKINGKAKKEDEEQVVEEESTSREAESCAKPETSTEPEKQEEPDAGPESQEHSSNTLVIDPENMVLPVKPLALECPDEAVVSNEESLHSPNSEERARKFAKIMKAYFQRTDPVRHRFLCWQSSGFPTVSNFERSILRFAENKLVGNYGHIWRREDTKMFRKCRLHHHSDAVREPGKFDLKDFYEMLTDCEHDVLSLDVLYLCSLDTNRLQMDMIERMYFNNILASDPNAEELELKPFTMEDLDGMIVELLNKNQKASLLSYLNRQMVLRYKYSDEADLQHLSRLEKDLYENWKSYYDQDVDWSREETQEFFSGQSALCQLIHMQPDLRRTLPFGMTETQIVAYGNAYHFLRTMCSSILDFDAFHLCKHHSSEKAKMNQLVPYVELVFGVVP